jgi:C_GCAxxG_C_C family probable redox protein
MSGRREDTMLKAVTGLEGGLVASGSTCGVVTCGALGIALMDSPSSTHREIMEKVSAYVDWFQDNFATSLCRERTGVDFYNATGQLRYIMPGNRVARCLWYIGKAMAYISSRREGPWFPQGEQVRESRTNDIHCAQAVLQGVRERIGVGDDLLEKASFVLDGGVAFRGGVCGAIAGAVMALNIPFGWNIREMSYAKTIKEFVVGHTNLLRKHPKAMPEPFAIGKELVRELRAKAGSLECRQIVGRSFEGYDDFQTYIHSSQTCTDLIKAAVEKASETIQRYR